MSFFVPPNYGKQTHYEDFLMKKMTILKSKRRKLEEKKKEEEKAAKERVKAQPGTYL